MFDTLFAVRKGVTALDAMNQTSCFLETARDLAYEEQSYAVGNLIELAKALVDSFVKECGGKHEPIMNTQKTKVHSPHDDLTGELIFLNDYLELIRDRANEGSDGKLVALVAAAMPRMNKALELSNELEVSHG